MQAVPQLLEHLRQESNKVIVGQEEFRDQCLATLLCRGHALLEGVPGVAKTLLVKTLSRILGLEFQRVQCTSDLMPADIIGTNVLNMATSAFNLHKGPVFTDLLLVDEVNRMPPRTQAALLECMEEYQVTIDGVRHQLPASFSVFATQNPVEFEGTYPLPEAQLDRFLLKIRVPYPAANDEVQILSNVCRHQSCPPEAHRDSRSQRVPASAWRHVVGPFLVPGEDVDLPDAFEDVRFVFGAERRPLLRVVAGRHCRACARLFHLPHHSPECASGKHHAGGAAGLCETVAIVAERSARGCGQGSVA